MKKIISLILACASVIVFASCSSGNGGTATKMAKILDPLEYTLYINIFGSDNADKYADTSYTKEGIFTELQDSFSSKTRYYVWGYSDETLCCDWQWEFVPQNKEELPPIGSHVTVTGNFVKNLSALDGYWIENASVKTVSKYEAAVGKLDTTTMSPTLAGVQLENIKAYAKNYNGETIKIYGRVMDDNKIQHPYYDKVWSISLDYDKELPAIGTYVTVTGKFTGTSISDSKIVVESIKADKK